MKGKYLLLAILTAARVTNAQLPIPEFRNEPMAIKNDSTLQRLEFTHYETTEHVNTDGLTFVSTSDLDYVVYDTPKSPVRLNTSTEFVVKVMDAEIDPESIFLLTKVECYKKKRVVYTTGNAGYSGESFKIKIGFKKIAPGIYKITPQKLLPKSEYAFVIIPDNGAKTRCYLFGTD